MKFSDRIIYTGVLACSNLSYSSWYGNSQGSIANVHLILLSLIPDIIDVQPPNEWPSKIKLSKSSLIPYGNLKRSWRIFGS